jgi:hypothetical protein
MDSARMRPTRSRLQPTTSPMMLNSGTYNSRDFGMPTWEQLREVCHVQFGSLLCVNPLGELARLSFTSSVADYISRFLALMCRNNEPLTQSQQWFLHTTGLLIVFTLMSNFNDHLTSTPPSPSPRPMSSGIVLQLRPSLLDPCAPLILLRSMQLQYLPRQHK